MFFLKRAKRALDKRIAQMCVTATMEERKRALLCIEEAKVRQELRSEYSIHEYIEEARSLIMKGWTPK